MLMGLRQNRSLNARQCDGIQSLHKSWLVQLSFKANLFHEPLLRCALLWK